MSHPEGVTVARFARDHGLTETAVRRLVKTGRILGARKHPLTKKWIIFPPAKLVLTRLSQGRVW
jgi:hypothetical protein